MKIAVKRDNPLSAAVAPPARCKGDGPPVPRYSIPGVYPLALSPFAIEGY